MLTSKNRTSKTRLVIDTTRDTWVEIRGGKYRFYHGSTKNMGDKTILSALNVIFWLSGLKLN